MYIHKYILSILFVVMAIPCQLLPAWAFTSGNSAEMYDLPLNIDKKNYVTYADKYKDEIEVVCNYYGEFIIKTVSHKGDIGVQSYIVPISGKEASLCQLETMAGEQKVDQNLPGADYFEGVRGNYAVFFSGDGSAGRGMPFLIVRISDSAAVYFDLAASDGNGGVAFYGIVPEKNGLLLRYTRNFEDASCSVPLEGRACIEKIGKMIGIGGNFERVCKEGYKKEYLNELTAECRNMPKDEKRLCIETKTNSVTSINIADGPSSISYDVEAFVPTSAPAIKYEQGMRLRYDSFLTKKGDVIDCRPFQ